MSKKEQCYTNNKYNFTEVHFDHSVYKVGIDRGNGTEIEYKMYAARSVAHLVDSLLDHQKLDSIYIKSIEWQFYVPDWYLLRHQKALAQDSEVEQLKEELRN